MNLAPKPAPSASSGKALDSPPAPTSCIETIGLFLPNAQQALITSWARRSISGLPRWTESKSKSAVFVPVATELPVAPPIPIRIPGPPSWISK